MPSHAEVIAEPKKWRYHNSMSKVAPALIAAVLTVLTTSPALADRLDGDWCNFDDGKLTIEGSTILTPWGTKVEGTYGRHRFDYTAPANDWHAGKSIVIQQYGDDLMELSVDGGQPKQWRPCQVVS